MAWHFVTDRFSAEELQTFTELNAVEGKVVKFHGRHLAVYKDELGKLRF